MHAGVTCCYPAATATARLHEKSIEVAGGVHLTDVTTQEATTGLLALPSDRNSRKHAYEANEKKLNKNPTSAEAKVPRYTSRNLSPRQRYLCSRACLRLDLDHFFIVLAKCPG